MDTFAHAPSLTPAASSIPPETYLVLLQGIPETASGVSSDGILERSDDHVSNPSFANPYPRPSSRPSSRSSPSLAEHTLQTNKRLIKVLDAFASLCVSETQHGVYAVALESAEKRTTLYVASNGDPPESVKGHLLGLTRQLSGLSALVMGDRDADVSIEVPDNEMTSAAVLNLQIYCHVYSMHKIKRRIEKRKRAFDSYMRRLVSKPPSAGAQHELYEKLVKFQTYLEVIMTGFTRPVEEVARKVAEVLVASAYSMRDYLQEDLTARSNESPLTQMDITFGTSTHFTMCRFLEKTFSTYMHVLNLVRLTGSARLQPFFQSKFSVVFIPRQHHTCSFPVDGPHVNNILVAIGGNNGTSSRQLIDKMKKNASNFKTKFSDNSVDNVTIKGNVHAECSLIAYLHHSDVNTYRYIGVSKLLCYGCFQYIQAYNNVCHDRGDLGWKFFVKGTHSKIYMPWIFPELGSLDPIIQEELEKRLRRDMEDFVFRASTCSVESDSSNASAVDMPFKVKDRPSDSRLAEAIQFLDPSSSSHKKKEEEKKKKQDKGKKGKGKKGKKKAI